MKLTIERDVLLKSLSHVQSVVERRTTIPILSNVKLETENGELRLKSTDMDLEVLESCPAQVSAAGAITVPAHTLYDIVRKLPDGAQVELKYDGAAERVVVRCGKSQFALACLPAEDFPVMATGDIRHVFPLSTADLKLLIDRTRFAISTEETRYYLNGIYLHATRDNGIDVLRAVATDGHRLARAQIALPAGAADMPGVIVPRKTIAELRKLLDEATAAVEVAVSATKIRFSVERAVLTSKLIDGTYPDYARVIPTQNDKLLDVDCAEFAHAVDRVSAISSDRSRAVKIKVAKGSLELSAVSAEHGSAHEELDVVYDGEPIEIGFNSKYLLDITDRIEGKSIRISMADPASPAILQDQGDETPSLYVLMPMRV